MSLYPKNSLALNAEGNYTFEVNGFEKNLSKATYNLDLKGKQENLYFNTSTDLEINLDDRKTDITNTSLNIYNKLYNLELFDISLGISQLVASRLNLRGAKFETMKKSNSKNSKTMFFAGKSSTAQVIGTKIMSEYGSNTSHSLFLLKEGDNQICGVNFSKPIHKFGDITGECYLDNKNKWGILLKDLVNYKKTTISTEYSIIDKVSAFKLFTIYKTKTANTELEFSTTDKNSLWKLKSDYKSKNFQTGGGIYQKKSQLSSISQETLSYNGYTRYHWKVSEKITPSVSYSHVNSNSSQFGKNKTDNISFGIDYNDNKSRLSMSAKIGLEMITQPTSKKLVFKNDLGMRGEYWGFGPWIKYSSNNTNDKRDISYQDESMTISYGVNRRIGRNLSLSYNSYQTKSNSQSSNKVSSNTRKNKYFMLDYRFPKLPLNLQTRLSWINEDKPLSFISITYREKGKKGAKDTVVKYQNEEIKYTRERAIKLGGTATSNIVSMTKGFPNQEELLELGRVITRVFKDIEFDGKWTKEKDIPLKGIKLTLSKIEILTDENGQASFLDIPPGTYTFDIDLTALPIGFACSNRVDSIIEIRKGQDIYLNFPIVRGCKISGGVFIDKNRNGIWDEKEKGAEDITISANGVIKYTSLTGKYEFRNFNPGHINLKIDTTSLPENFELTTKECIELNILPEQEIKNINFGIAEIEPEIEFE